MKRLLVSWGNGELGRLGHGLPAISELYPRVCRALLDYEVKHVSCGGVHTAVVTEDGSLFTFGFNKYGQLGHSTHMHYVPVPQEVPLPEAPIAVSAGESHTLCITESGALWSFGNNSEGQVGVGADFPSAVRQPRLVKALRGKRVVAAAAGHQHSLALTDDGNVYAWGCTAFGCLGIGPVEAHVEWQPRLVRSLAGRSTAHIAAGHHHSGAIDSEGNLMMWGHGGWGQLGLGNHYHLSVPAQVRSAPPISRLSLGAHHSLATTPHHTPLIWGTDHEGCLGQGWAWPPPPPLLTPHTLKSKLKLNQISCGWRHNLGSTEDGRVFSWGWGGAVGQGGLINPDADLGGGQLGVGDTDDYFELTEVGRIKTGEYTYLDRRRGGGAMPAWVPVQLSCGLNHSAAVLMVDKTLAPTP